MLSEEKQRILMLERVSGSSSLHAPLRQIKVTGGIVSSPPSLTDSTHERRREQEAQPETGANFYHTLTLHHTLFVFQIKHDNMVQVNDPDS